MSDSATTTATTPNKTPDIQVITFDLDDTLWNLKPVIIEADRLAKAFLAEHAPKMVARYDEGRMTALRRKLISREPGLRANLSRLRTLITFEACRRSGYSDADAQHIADTAFEIFIEARHRVALFDGVDDMLSRLREQYTLGALTNGNASIERLGLMKYFHFGFSSESVGKSKPDPAMFKAALDHVQAAPESMLHVGDHAEHDIVGAQRLGIHTAWINPEGHDFPHGTEPSVTLSHVTGLEAWLLVS